MEDDRLPGFATLAVHAGARREAGLQVDAGESAPALDVFGGVPLRAASPVVAALEEKIATLEGGSAAVCVPSANAVLALAVHALLRPGDEFVAARPLNDDVAAQFSDAFPRFGWTAQWADAGDQHSFEKAVSPRTKAIFVESVSEAGTVADIAALAAVARRARVPLVVDNSLATPFLCRPFDHGADIVLHTRTMLLGGSGDIAGGAIVDGGEFDWSEERRYPLLSEPLAERGSIVLSETFGNVAFVMACRALSLGGISAEMLPSIAERILSGIETLPLRLQRHSDNARAVAAWLSGRESVRWVSYPGLPGDRYHNLSRQYQPSGAGPLVNFGVDGEVAASLLSGLKLVSTAVAAGGTRSSIRRVEKASSAAAAFRLFVGIEDRDDIVADLERALAAT